MVAGADLLLDKLAEGKDEVTLLLDTYPIPYSDGTLVKKYSKLTQGGVYYSEHMDIGSTEIGVNQLWLCPATLWVFLRYPNKIYFKVDRTQVQDKERVNLWESLFGISESNQELSLT